MIKTYLVPVSEEVVKMMEKGEAPSFLHCATCLDGLTNGEVIQKMFPNLHIQEGFLYFHLKGSEGAQRVVATFDEKWMNRKWGE